jgi:hypothetical protein
VHGARGGHAGDRLWSSPAAIAAVVSAVATIVPTVLPPVDTM